MRITHQNIRCLLQDCSPQNVYHILSVLCIARHIGCLSLCCSLRYESVCYLPIPMYRRPYSLPVSTSIALHHTPLPRLPTAAKNRVHTRMSVCHMRKLRVLPMYRYNGSLVDFDITCSLRYEIHTLYAHMQKKRNGSFVPVLCNYCSIIVRACVARIDVTRVSVVAAYRVCNRLVTCMCDYSGVVMCRFRVPIRMIAHTW